MDESDVTQVMPPADEPAVPGEGAPDAVAEDAARGRARLPRRWLAAAVVLVMLLVAGLGVFLGMQAGGEPERVVEAGTDSEEKAGAEEVVVPDLRGMTLDRATTDAEAAGLVIGATATAIVAPSVTPAGTVLSQDPLPGAEVAAGTEISLVIAEAAAEEQPPAETSGGSSGGGTAEEQPPPAPPGDLTIDDFSKLVAKPRVIDPNFFVLQQWTTKLEHSDTALQWTSGPVDFGGGDKQIILNADGPNGYLVAVYSWDSATSTDWKMQSIIVSQPGELPYQTIFDVPASTQTFMVKSMSTAVYWTLTVQEK
ncbi:MAG: PASTA domain-containing protein [Actinobacteria bacterium]|nr:PASTA domain-containing protein [Actinomycetota bacterium]